MTDIVERLGWYYEHATSGELVLRNFDGPEAAAEIERLRARLAEAVEEIERAARAFELLALADDTQRNGVTPSVRASDLRAFLAKLEDRS